MANFERNSFPDARANGYAEGLLQGLYRMSKKEVKHDADRNIDYIQWFDEAFKSGYDEGLTLDVPMILFTDDFKTGFVQGWQVGYAEFIGEFDETELIENPTQSYLKGFDFGMFDGESQGFKTQMIEDMCFDRLIGSAQ